MNEPPLRVQVPNNHILSQNKKDNYFPQPKVPYCWVLWTLRVISRFISRLTIVITYTRGLIAPLITSHLLGPLHL